MRIDPLPMTEHLEKRLVGRTVREVICGRGSVTLVFDDGSTVAFGAPGTVLLRVSLQTVEEKWSDL